MQRCSLCTSAAPQQSTLTPTSSAPPPSNNRRSDQPPGTAWTYGYDTAGRLTDATTPAETFNYSYDKNSNRLTTQPGQTPAVYNNLDQLTNATEITGTPAYDPRGNTTALNGLTLGWDATDRNTSISDGTTIVDYTRDSADRVKTRTENAAAHTYLYDSASDAPIGIADANGTVTEWYVGLPGNVVRTVDPVPGNDKWLLPNLHGDTLATISSTGQKASGPHLYEPFGEPILTTTNNGGGFVCAVEDSGNGFVVSWNDQSAATDYVIRRSVDGGPVFWRGRVDSPGVQFSDSGLPGGATAAAYKVEARDASQTVIEQIDCTEGPLPTNNGGGFVCAVEDTGNGFVVSWNDQAAATDYVIRRSVDGGPVFWRGRVDSPGVQFSDSGLPGGATAAVYKVDHGTLARQ